MSGKTNIWWPMYVGDHLSRTMTLSLEQEGTYIRLLNHYWHQQHPISDDDTALARVARITEREWKKLRPAVAPLFQVAGGVWRCDWLDAEIVKARENSQKRRKAAMARWDKDGQKTDAHAYANAMQMECPSPSPSPVTNHPNGALSPEFGPRDAENAENPDAPAVAGGVV